MFRRWNTILPKDSYEKEKDRNVQEGPYSAVLTAECRYGQGKSMSEEFEHGRKYMNSTADNIT